MTTCLKGEKMLKENGRKKKTNYPEFAKSLMRVFKCGSCGEAVGYNSVQFGVAVDCPVCGKEMAEEVRK